MEQMLDKEEKQRSMLRWRKYGDGKKQDDRNEQEDEKECDDVKGQDDGKHCSKKKRSDCTVSSATVTGVGCTDKRGDMRDKEGLTNGGGTDEEWWGYNEKEEIMGKI